MATKMRLIPTNVDSTRVAVTGHNTYYMGVEAPNEPTTVPIGASNNHNNSTASYIQFVPASTGRTTTVGSVPAAPGNWNGWILPCEYSGDTAGSQLGVVAGTYNYSFNLNAGATPSTFTIEFRLWKLTCNNVASTTNSADLSGSLVASWNKTGVAPASATSYTGTYTIPSDVDLAPNEYLFLQVWSRMTTNATTDTIAINVNTENTYVEVGFDDSGYMWSKETSRPYTVVWNNKTLVVQSKYGQVIAVKNVTNNDLILGRNAVPFESTTTNADAIYWQIDTAATIRNAQFASSPQTQVAPTEANPVFTRMAVLNAGAADFGSATNCDWFVSMWYNKEFFTFTWWLDGASSQTIGDLTFRIATKNDAGDDGSTTCGGTSNLTSGTHYPASATTAGAWVYVDTGATYGYSAILDRHRGTSYEFEFVPDGTNSGTINNAQVIDTGDVGSKTQWGARAIVGWDADASISTYNTKMLNNFSKHVNGPPTIANSRFAVVTGTVKADDDSGVDSILSGFDYDRMAHRVTAASNEIKVKVQAHASHANPFRMFIIEGYTATTAPVVASSATQGGTYTELDSGKTSHNTATYKGTNFASHVDTTNDIAYVVIYGDQAANNTTYYQIKDALSTAWTQTLTDTVNVQGGNYFGVDGGFEIDTDGNGIADGWTNNQSLHTFSLVAGNGSGKAQRLVLPAGSASTPGIRTLDIAVKENTTYTVGIDKKYDTTSGWTYGWYVYNVNAAGFFVSNSTMGTKSTSWGRATPCTFTTPAGCTSIRIYVLKNGGTDATTTFDIDNFVLSVGDTDLGATYGNDPGIQKTAKPVLADTWSSILDSIVNKAKPVLADSYTVGDTAVFKAMPTLSDSISSADTIVFNVYQVIAEAVSLVDALANKFSTTKSESIAANDDTSVFSLQIKALLEEIVDMSTDAIQKLPKLVKSENIGPSDAMTSLLTLKKALTEIITLTDAIVNAAKPLIAETLSLADAFAVKVGKYLSDVPTISETWTTLATYKRTLSETQTLAESLRFVVGLVVSENQNTSDSFASVHWAYRSFGEVLSVTDAIFNKAKFTLSDVMTLADDFQRLVQLALADSIASADVAKKKIVLVISHTVSIIETWRNKPKVVLPGDSMTLDDGTSSTMAKKLFSESISMTETALSFFVKAVIEEAITLQEAFQTGKSININETITLVENQIFNVKALFADAATVADDVAKRAILAPFQEAVTMADALAAKFIKVFSETISAADATVITRTLGKLVEEAITLADTARFRMFAVFTESASISDAMEYFTELQYSFSDAVTMADDIAKKAVFTLVDAITTSEVWATVTAYKRTLTQTISMADTFQRNLYLVLEEAYDGILDAFVYTYAITIDLIFKSNVRNAIGKTLVNRAQILDTIVRELTTVLNLLKNARRDLVIRSTSREAVGDNLVVQSNVNAPVTKDLVFQANVANRIQRVLRSYSSILANVSKELGIGGATIVNFVGKSLVMSMTSRELVAQTFTSLANTEQQIGRTLVTVNNVLNVVTEDLTAKSGILSNVSQDLDFSANLLTKCAKSLIIDTGFVYGLVGTDLTFLVSGVAPVVKTLTFKQHVQQAIAKVLTEKANIAEIVQKNLTFDAHMYNRVGVFFTSVADMYQIAGKSLIEQANVFEIVRKDIVNRTNFLNTVGVDLTEIADMAHLVGYDLDATAQILTKAGQNLTFRAKSEQNITKDLVSQANIHMHVAQELGVLNQILTDIQKDLNFVNGLIYNHVGMDVTEVARIRARVGKNLTEVSQILRNVNDTLTISNSITRSVGRTLTTRMAGEGKVVYNLPIFAKIDGQVTKELTMLANVANPIIRTFALDPILEDTEVETLDDYIVDPYFLPYEEVSTTLPVSYRVKR